MGIYREKKEQLIEKIKVYEARIASDTAKKKAAEEKLKEVSRLAMAEEYNCKPRDLDEIISAEHQLLEQLRASGLSDADLLELVSGKNADSVTPSDNGTADSNLDNADLFADSFLRKSDYRSDNN